MHLQSGALATGSGLKAAWPTATHWSAVLAAGASNSPESAAALEELCLTYWYPIYAYIRRRGHDDETAKDLTQEFLAQVLEHNWFEQVDPCRGKFRSFLLTCLTHFLDKEWRKAHAAKRGGGRPIVSLDDTTEQQYASEPASDLSPEKLFDRKWLLQLFRVSLERLRDQYTRADKQAVFESLKEFLSSEVVDGDYQRLSAALSMSPGAVCTAVCRLRDRYRDLVRAEIARTVANTADVDEEIRSLLQAMS